MRKEYTITSNQDNLKLSILEYAPKHPKAIIQIVHGMSEHKERYKEFMSYFQEKGYLCIISDLRGHGESILNESDLGYFYDETSDYVVEDIHQITNHIKDEYPNIPVYLLGHSMGSLIARKYIKKYDKEIDKLIVCGSPSQINFIDVGIFFAKVEKLFKGDRYRSNFLQKLTFGSYEKKFRGEIENSWINSDIKEVRKYNKDPKSGYIFTVNGFLTLYRLLKETYSRKGWEFNNPDLQILFIAGQDDPVIINESAWLNSMTFLREIGYNDIKHIIYENDRHEILKEKNQEKVYNDIYKFISRKK